MRYVPDPRDLAHALLHRLRHARTCCLGSLILLLLLFLGSCAALGWGAARVTAAQPATGSDILLLIDHSRSLYDTEEPGSDPELLRLQGARWLAGDLALSGAREHRLALAYFGTEARLVVPLEPVGDASDWPFEDPGPMGWTDFEAALDLAQHELLSGPRAETARAKVIVLLTDGLPQTANADEPATEGIRQRVAALDEEGVALYVLLLARPGNRDAQRIAAAESELWQELGRSHHVELFPAPTATALAEAYRAIARRLHAGAAPRPSQGPSVTPPRSATPRAIQSAPDRPTPTEAATATALEKTVATTTASGGPDLGTPPLPAAGPPPPAPAGPSPRREGRPRLMGGALLLALAAGGAWALAHRRRRPHGPRLAGRLCLVAAPEGGLPAGQRWDLEGLREAEVAIGSAAACTLRLTGERIPPRVGRLRAATTDGEPVVQLQADAPGTLRVNGIAPVPWQALAHGDHLELGGYLLRYENVLRAARRRPSPRGGRPNGAATRPIRPSSWEHDR